MAGIRRSRQVNTIKNNNNKKNFIVRSLFRRGYVEKPVKASKHRRGSKGELVALSLVLSLFLFVVQLYNIRTHY